MSIEEIRVLHITNVMDYSGTAKIVGQICTCTMDIMDKVIVMSSGGDAADRLQSLGVDHVYIPDLSSRKIGDVATIAHTLKKCIVENRINLIHCHHRMALLYARTMFPKIKVIFNNHTTYFDKKFMTHCLCKGIDIVAVGEKSMRNMTVDYNIDREKVVKINNAVDYDTGYFEEVKKFTQAHDKNQFVVLNVSRLHPQKAVHYFVESAKLLIEQKLKIKFFIVGDGELENEIKEQIERLGLSESVEMLGQMLNIRNVMKQADLLVQTSIYEGMPLTPMEAFSVHKTVVATDVEGTDEVVKHEVNGLLVESGNPYSIAQGIRRFYEDRAYLDKMNKSAFESFEKDFSLSAFSKAYLAFYKKIWDISS